MSREQRSFVPRVEGLEVRAVPSNTPLVSVSRTFMTVREAGETVAAYTMVLRSQPTDDVTIDLTATNGQVTVTPASLTFTPASWNLAKTVKIKAIDDNVIEKNPQIDIITSAVVSADTDYDGLSVPQSRVVIIDNDTGKVLNLTDEDGDKYTVILNGPGTLDLVQDDAAVDGRGAIESIRLEGTDQAKTLLAVKVTGIVGDGIIPIGSIHSSAGLSLISAASSDLMGDGIDIDGFLGTLTLHDIKGGADILTRGGAAQKSAITVNVVEDDSTWTFSNVLSVKAAAIGHGTIEAPSMPQLLVTGSDAVSGDCQADITVPKLGEATIAGKVDAGTTWMFDSAGNITIKGTIDQWALKVTGTVKALLLGDVGDADVQVDKQITRLEVQRWTAGSLQTNVLSSLAVTGDGDTVPGDFLIGLTVTTLGGTTIAGDLTSATWNIAANATNITALGKVDQWSLQVGGNIIGALLLPDVTDASVQVEGAIAKLQAVRWAAGTLEAATIGGLKIVGDDQNNIPGDFPLNLTVGSLGTAIIAGSVNASGGSTWTAASVGTIRIAAPVDQWSLQVAENLGGLVLSEVTTITVQVGKNITALTANRWDAGTIQAGSLTTFKITGNPAEKIVGDFTGQITLTGLGHARGAQICKTIDIVGAVHNSSFAVDGSIGTITVGEFVDSALYVGFVPTDAADPLAGGTFTKGFTLANFTAKGIEESANASLQNSTLAAATVGVVTLASFATDNGGTLYGVIAHVKVNKVKSLAQYFDYRSDAPNANFQGRGDFQVVVL